jgi:hypothetical protein
MKNQGEQKNKLSFKKFQISKIKNPQKIVGGNAPGIVGDNDDDDGGRTRK